MIRAFSPNYLMLNYKTGLKLFTTLNYLKAYWTRSCILAYYKLKQGVPQLQNLLSRHSPVNSTSTKTTM